MQNAKEIAQVLAIVMIACFLAQGLFSLVTTSLNKSEVVSCLKLQEQAVEYGGFYLTDWQSDMCEAHRIIINAPVK